MRVTQIESDALRVISRVTQIARLTRFTAHRHSSFYQKSIYLYLSIYLGNTCAVPREAGYAAVSSDFVVASRPRSSYPKLRSHGARVGGESARSRHDHEGYRKTTTGRPNDESKRDSDHCATSHGTLHGKYTWYRAGSGPGEAEGR